MPVYLHLANLVFDKKIIDYKYKGGCAQFKVDFDFENSTVNQEDDELFLIASMNISEFDISFLIEKGLSFKDNSSNDFVAISRYGGAAWKIDWLEDNNVFAWSVNCTQSQKNRALEIGEISMDEISKLYNKGIHIFQTIKTPAN